MDLRPTNPMRIALAVAAVAAAGTGCHRVSSAERAAAPIVERNAAARGGLDAWRAVHSLSMTGKLGAGVPRDPVKLAASFRRTREEMKTAARRSLARGGTEAPPPVQLPFVMELERPRKSRVEVEFRGQAAVQVYDGREGWKLRPFLGRHEVEPFSAEEMRVAARQADLDGPLLDHAVKGSRVELVGTEPVDGRPAHHLKVTARDGSVRNVWVDAETYLDVMVDGSRRMDGKERPVFTHLRDYRKVGGVLVPFEMETTVEGVRGSEKIHVERVVLNPQLDGARFARPI